MEAPKTELERLEALEWEGSEDRDLGWTYQACPVCLGWSPHEESAESSASYLATWNDCPEKSYGPPRAIGHAPGCWLAARIAELRELRERSVPGCVEFTADFAPDGKSRVTYEAFEDPDTGQTLYRPRKHTPSTQDNYPS